MVRQIKFLTIVENTAYFFCKEINYLLPITITGSCLNSLLEAGNFLNPQIHNTFLRTLRAFGTKICGIKIYTTVADNMQAYLKLNRGDKVVEINSNFEDCLIFLVKGGVKVEITEEILLEKGFFVTKQLIKEALAYTEIT